MSRLSALILCATFSLAACSTMPPSADVAEAAAQKRGAEAETTAEIHSLRHLTRVNIDAKELYKDAGDIARNKDLKAELSGLVIERRQFAEALQARTVELGGQPAEIGEPAGTFLRSFTRLRSLLHNDSLTAAREVYRSESYVQDQVEHALGANITPTSKNLLEQELESVKSARTRIRQLGDRIEEQVNAN